MAEAVAATAAFALRAGFAAAGTLVDCVMASFAHTLSGLVPDTLKAAGSVSAQGGCWKGEAVTGHNAGCRRCVKRLSPLGHFVS